MTKGTFFTDFDGTLSFNKDTHRVRVVGHPIQELGAPAESIQVTDALGKKHFAYDISTGKYHVYLAQETLRLIQELANDYDFVVVTGSKYDSIEDRKKLFSFGDDFVLENGGMILDSDFQIDEEWRRWLAQDKSYLDDVAAYLTNGLKWKIDRNGRTAVVRVKLSDNPARSLEDFQELYDTLVIPDELNKTLNQKHLDIILAKAGKENAIYYLMTEKGYKNRIGIGDDVNDLNFFILMDHVFVLGSSHPDVLDKAREKGYHVSKGLYFDGINEILEEIKKL
ncbi:MAG: HAD hydrolase family protein [Nanoarchaeota archaeon]|nr:HAD hydrolase family protein [Nanoarchaeota archaeon]